jgi:peptidase E
MHLPCCFFEENEFVHNLKKYWKQDANCLIISASPLEFKLNDEMAFTFRRALLYHGMIPMDVKVCDARTDLHTADMVAWSDVIFLSGGHVPTQMAFFEKINLRELLQGYKGIVIGISAGSMNCAKTVYAQPEEEGESQDPDYQRFIPGLGLTQYQILPHYQMVKDHILDGKRLYEDIIYEDSVGEKFYALPDSSYILQADGKKELYGEAYLLQDRKLTKICRAGQKIDLSKEI